MDEACPSSRAQASVSVLFIHGLESHPNGSKVRALRARGFAVTAPDLMMGLTQLRRRNSAVRQLASLAEVRVVAGVASLLLIAAIVAGAWALAGAMSVAVALWLVVRGQALFAAALSRSFEACVRIAASALAQTSPDVLVGSSWGGAVAVELIASGAWRGPTILLAPAVARVHAWTRRADAQQQLERARAACSRAPLVIFHDPHDEVVPFQDSVALARHTSIALRAVDAGGHRLMALLEGGELAATIHALAGEASRR